MSQPEQKTTSSTQDTTPISKREEYNYYPSISSGIFGSYTITNISALKPTPDASDNDDDEKEKETTTTKTTKNPPYLRLSRKWKSPGKSATTSKGCGVEIIAQWFFNKHDNKDDCAFYVCSGSVVTFKGEAIVNAANEGGLSGGGVDGAISVAGGKKLKEMRHKLPQIKIPITNKNIRKNKNVKDRIIRIRTGSAVITGSGYGSKDCKLKCKYVLHAVGPNYNTQSLSNNFEKCDNLLYNAYKICMVLGKEHEIETMAFSLLSASLFRGLQSLDNILKIACQSINDNVYNECKGIYLVAFKPTELYTLLNAAQAVFGNKFNVYDEKVVDKWNKWKQKESKKGKKKKPASKNKMTKQQK